MFCATSIHLTGDGEEIHRAHHDPHIIIQGKINCGASSQADFIQNYILQKRIFRKQCFHRKEMFCTKKLFLAQFGPFSDQFGPFLTIFDAKTPF